MILTEEILLFQKRAGIITESEHKEKLKEILLEGNAESLVKDPNILALAAKIVKQPVAKIEDKVEDALAGKEEEKKEEVNETLALTLALALPLILEAGGSLANLLKRKFGLDKETAQRYENWKKLYKQSEERLEAAKQEKDEAGVEKEKKQQEELKKLRDKEFGSDFGKKMIDAGHGLHKLYTSPIRAILWVISKFTPKGSDLREKGFREKLANLMYAAGMLAFGITGAWNSISGLPGVAEYATALLDGAKAGKSAEEILTGIPLVVKALSA